MRTKFIDYDSRKKPKTQIFCVMCQRDIRPNQKCRWVHIIQGGSTVLHPADESLYTPDAGDVGWYRIGSDCAKRLGLEWTVEIEP